MVDNVAITAGTGTTIAADDIGLGVLAQRVKPVWGPDGTGNDIDVATGKPLPVQLRSATGLIPFGEPTDAANAATDATSVSGISLWKQLSIYLKNMSDNVVTLGRKTQPLSMPVVLASFEYETVAASATAQILGATGAVGDFLEGVLCVVATAATSQVQITDGNGSAITILPNAVGAGVGTYYIPIGLLCANATTPGWKITTAAGVSVIGVGKFT